MRNLSSQRKLKSLCGVALSGVAAYGVISFYKSEEKFYRNVIMPVVHLFEPEKVHRLAVLANKYRLIPKSNFEDPEILKIVVFGKEFKNPVGIAAGYDKNGEAVLGLADIGFGFVEVGSVTPEPQPGNEKPRVFRLPEDLAVINRYGFNSDGHETVFERLNRVKSSNNFKGVIGVNLGKNKTSKDAVNDYVMGIRKFGPVADYLVINISSPNTPGLRSLQNKKLLAELLKAAVTERNNLPPDHRPPLLLKLAPDLIYDEIKDISKVIEQKECRVDGLIISNTTIKRPEFLNNTDKKNEVGGLSGKPLKDLSTKMVKDVYKLTKGTIPIIGVGGISSGKDAYDKIRAGASVVQIYTGLVYEGPPIVAKIKKELTELLEQDGFKNVAEAVGADAY